MGAAFASLAAQVEVLEVGNLGESTRIHPTQNYMNKAPWLGGWCRGHQPGRNWLKLVNSYFRIILRATPSAAGPLCWLYQETGTV